MTRLVALIGLAVAIGGCGGNCAEIVKRKQALLSRTTGAAGPHVEVRIPFARANAFLADLLRDNPIVAPIDPPKLGLFVLPLELTAVAHEVKLAPAGPEHVRFAIRLDIADHAESLTTLDLVAEVEPRLDRTKDGTSLITGFGPENLVDAEPVLGSDATQRLAEAIARHLPEHLKKHVPQAMLDEATVELANHLVHDGYKALHHTLLRRLGEVTELRVRLPDLPVASTHVTSTPEALAVAIATDLPVRQSLAAATTPSTEISIRLSASTATELANWAIAHGRLPQHYTRSLKPSPNGEYVPILDYRADDKQRPVKIHVFQERGGCSYFGVGLWFYIGVEHDKLVASVLDQYVEDVDASAPLELALGIKQLLLGATENTKRIAAHTRLTVGTRSFTTRVTRAAAIRDELDFDLAFAAEPSAR